MITFHKLLPEEDPDFNNIVFKHRYALDHKDIVLKYRYPLPNGTFVWAGLSAMMESNALWNEMTSSMGHPGVVLGVSYHQMESLAHLKDMPVGMYLFKAAGSLIRKTERRPVPPTYEVCYQCDFSFASFQILTTNFLASQMAGLHNIREGLRKHPNPDSFN